ncbi:MAG: CBS domain-containing protein [Gammaproteobacteria bacterium]|nr:CBS domain-containing protein [Gammaproteobacteria bacterium]
MQSLPLMPAKLAGEGVLPQRSAADGRSLSGDDPAILAVTDFTREAPITVEEERSIDAALEDMIRFGVRALLVVRDRKIAGLITSYDIQGERPLQFLRNSTYEHHSDIRVGHVMTPWAELRAVEWTDLQQARAATLLEALRHEQLTHLLVVEKTADHRFIVRALASRARLERQLAEKAQEAHSAAPRTVKARSAS